MKENNKEKECIEIVPCSKSFVMTAEEYAKAMEYFNSPEYQKIKAENKKILKKIKNQIDNGKNDAVESINENSI